jgi:hypothetical protein
MFKNIHIGMIRYILTALPLSGWVLMVQKQGLRMKQAPKTENCRIDTIYPLSFLDFDRSARNSLVKHPLTCQKCVT